MLVVIYLWVFFWPPLVSFVLSGSHVFAAYYGPEAAALTEASPARDQAIAAARAWSSVAEGLCRQSITGGPVAQLLSVAECTMATSRPDGADPVIMQVRQRWLQRFNLWALVLAFPLQFASVPLLLHRFSHTLPAELGLTARRLGRNLLAGLLTALVLTPVVLGVNFCVESLYELGLPGKTQQHPLTLVAQEHLRPTEMGLLVFVAVVTAPVMEELIFRGVLQPYLAARRYGGHVGMAAALGLAVAACGRDVWNSRLGTLGDLLAAGAPALFILAMLPIFFIIYRTSRTPAAPAIFGTSLAFAAIHSSVWPTPVALFLLGLGLGTLAWRSRSLVGPIMVHGLFNGVSCVLLFVH
jgi:membrane protease YdiL (CAAX protease family)